MTITDSSRASTPAQGPSTTPLPTNPRRLDLLAVATPKPKDRHVRAGAATGGCVLAARAVDVVEQCQHSEQVAALCSPPGQRIPDTRKDNSYQVNCSFSAMYGRSCACLGQVDQSGRGDEQSGTRRTMFYGCGLDGSQREKGASDETKHAVHAICVGSCCGRGADSRGLW